MEYTFKKLSQWIGNGSTIILFNPSDGSTLLWSRCVVCCARHHLLHVIRKRMIAYLFSVSLSVFRAASMRAADRVVAAHSTSAGASLLNELAKAHMRLCDSSTTLYHCHVDERYQTFTFINQSITTIQW